MKKFFALVMILFTVTACAHIVDNHRVEAQKAGVVAITSQSTIDKTKSGLGSGFFIKENYIITNYHVTGGPEYTLKVIAEGSSTGYDAEVLMSDKDTDIAVVKLKNWDEFIKKNPNIKYLEFAHRMPETTDTAWVIGHPWGLFWSVSKGIISIEGRKSPAPFPMWWIQSDAHIYNGNSGGPMLNDDADVIGINSIMMAKEGGSYGFAIPFPIIQKVINDLEKYKEVRWLSLGISYEDPGVTIKDVVPNSAAQKAGLMPGDQILKVRADDDDHRVRINTGFELVEYLSALDYANKVELTVKRKDRVIDIMVQPDFKLSSDYSK